MDQLKKAFELYINNNGIEEIMGLKNIDQLVVALAKENKVEIVKKRKLSAEVTPDYVKRMVKFMEFIPKLAEEDFEWQIETVETVIDLYEHLFTPKQIQCESITYQKGLGFGNFGSVYRALVDGENVAVKTLTNNKATMNLLHEIVMIRYLQHDRIVRYNGYAYNWKNGLSLVMEDCAQGSLADIFR